MADARQQIRTPRHLDRSSRSDSNSTSSAPNSRAIAAQILVQTLPLGRQNVALRSLSDSLPGISEQHPTLDKAFVQALCFGVCRWYTRLEQIANQLMHKPFKSADADLHALLLVGLHQLFDMRVPDHAAISATVDGCRALDKPWATKALNAMLRRASRERDAVNAKISDSLAVQQAHPQWMVDLLTSAWPQQAAAILRENNQQAPLVLRVNARKLTRDDYLERLRLANIRAEPCRFAGQGVRLLKACPVTELPGFHEGWFAVQDEAAQLAARLLDVQPGDTVLDACAAPGGKTCHLLELQPQLASLTAVDIDAHRCERINANLDRLDLRHGGPSVNVVSAGMLEFTEQTPAESFDRILLDVPCSASGVIRRHPDIKWLRKRADINTLAQQQLALLTAVWSLLKPGGYLLYATCSVFPQENERVIGHFLKHQADASESLLIGDWGQGVSSGRQLFPQRDGHDGFYYARLRKVAPLGESMNLDLTQDPSSP